MTTELKVTQADIDLANEYLSSAFRCTATLAERFAKVRLAERAFVVSLVEICDQETADLVRNWIERGDHGQGEGR